jgi:hypothetical protein
MALGREEGKGNREQVLTSFQIKNAVIVEMELVERDN